MPVATSREVLDVPLRRPSPSRAAAFSFDYATPAATGFERMVDRVGRPHYLYGLEMLAVVNYALSARE